MLRKGFTLLELLIVISIIGIVSLVIISSVKEAKEKGVFAQTVLQFQQVEKAFFLSFLDENREVWWTEAELGLGGNPRLNDILAIESGPLSTFSDNFPSSPNNYISDAQYRYDNDSNVVRSCTQGNQDNGVNLVIDNIPIDLRDRMDKYIDGEADPFCGKITYNPQAIGRNRERMFYKIQIDGAHF